MINSLPDNVLLETFDLYRMDKVNASTYPWKWHRLAHVCRTWRDIIFASSCRLDLELLCTYRTPVKKNLGHLPTLPLVIHYPNIYDEDSDEDNIIAALEQPNRVHVLKIPVSCSLSGKMATVTEPFPALTDLCLKTDTDEPMPVLPDAFLGGNTPRLRRITLVGIPFPKAPTLLSSARDLVSIDLDDIPDNGYISPEAMVASLAALPRLEYLSFGFHCGTSYPRLIRLSPLLAPVTRAVLPSLTTFMFEGLFEYLEEFVAQIDTPQLECLKVDYVDENEGVDFQVPQLCKFINRSDIFKQHQFRLADLVIEDFSVAVELDGRWMFRISILEEWISEMLSQISGMLSNVDRLFISRISEKYSEPGRVQWLELLRPFTAVKALGVQNSLSRYVVHALKSVVAESTTEILPALEFLFLENEEVTRVKDFVAARRNLGRPVTFVNGISEARLAVTGNVDDSK